jgi:hypothetical protein
MNDNHQNSNPPTPPESGIPTLARSWKIPALFATTLVIVVGIIAALALTGNNSGNARPSVSMVSATPTPTATPTPLPPPSPTLLHIAAAPTVAAAPTATSPAAADQPTATSPTADNQPTANNQPAATSQPSASPETSIAPTPPTPLAANPPMVQGVAIALAQSDPGTWQATTSGTTTYLLPEGAEEGEALGQAHTVAGTSFSAQIATSGDDCGIAVGSSPRDFILLRLRPAGQHETDVLLDQWQGDNYTTPPPITPLIITSSGIGNWHNVTLNWTDGQLQYTIDQQSNATTLPVAAGATAYLYAGGSGCQYRPTP